MCVCVCVCVFVSLSGTIAANLPEVVATHGRRSCDKVIRENPFRKQRTIAIMCACVCVSVCVCEYLADRNHKGAMVKICVEATPHRAAPQQDACDTE